MQRPCKMRGSWASGQGLHSRASRVLRWARCAPSIPARLSVPKEPTDASAAWRAGEKIAKADVSDAASRFGWRVAPHAECRITGNEVRSGSAALWAHREFLRGYFVRPQGLASFDALQAEGKHSSAAIAPREGWRSARPDQPLSAHAGMKVRRVKHAPGIALRARVRDP